MSEQSKAFAKFDLKGEDLVHRIISGAVKVSATDHAYALLWLAEREKNRMAAIERDRKIDKTEQRPNSNADEHLEIAKSAASAHYHAALAAVQSAKSQERTVNSARIVNSLALIAIAVSVFALWSEGQKERASIQKTAAMAVQTVAEILGQL